MILMRGEGKTGKNIACNICINLSNEAVLFYSYVTTLKRLFCV